MYRLSGPSSSDWLSSIVYFLEHVSISKEQFNKSTLGFRQVQVSSAQRDTPPKLATWSKWLVVRVFVGRLLVMWKWDKVGEVWCVWIVLRKQNAGDSEMNMIYTIYIITRKRGDSPLYSIW